MKVSIIVTCGYNPDSVQLELEKDRLIKFTKCLSAINKLNFESDDEVIISEYSSKEYLKNIVFSTLSLGFKKQYICSNKKDSKYFNQSISKNAAIKVANGDILYFINSDIILEKNIFQVIREEFGSEIDNKFCIGMRHDVFIKNEEVENFIEEINLNKNYSYTENIKIQDPGWLYALDKLDESYKVKVFTHPSYKDKMIYDFMQGYFVFGDCFGMSKNTALKFMFDDKCVSLTDVFERDRIFNHNQNGYHFIYLQHKTACFHLSGQDYGAQTKVGTEKEKRLMEDQHYLMNKYDELHFWSIFGYHKDFDLEIAQWYTKKQVKELIEKYRTLIYWKYFTDKSTFCATYNVNETI